MKTLLSFLIGILLSGLFSYSSAQENARTFELDDIGKLSTLTEPQISPDGKSIMLIVSKPDYEKNRYSNAVYLVDISSGTSQKLTCGRPFVHHARWSPKGNQIAFIAIDQTNNNARFQVYVLPMNSGEAVKLTNSPTGVEQFSWSSDGSTIACVEQDEPENKSELERGYDAFEIKYNGMFLQGKPRPSHIWLISTKGGEAKRLTSGEWTIGDSPLSWSPDGKRIAFQRDELPNSGRFYRQVQTVDLETGKIESITTRETKDHPMIFETSPSFSPDGKYIAYWFPRNGIINGSEVFITSGDGNDGKSITDGLDRCFYSSEWTSDSQTVLVAANDYNTVSVWVVSIDGEARKINLSNLCVTGKYGYNLTTGPDGSVALIASSSRSPEELYYLSSGDSAPRKLTSFNAEVAAMNLGAQETMRWKSNSYRPNGILTFPPDFDATKKYPLVLWIHGGPDESSKEQFNENAQSVASRGYIVFEPNYRGSDNLGTDFLLAVKGNEGAGPGQDIMKGIEDLKKRPYVNPEKIAVCGWSYGGFMTTWLIGNNQGWACAVAGAAITDLIDQYSLSDIGFAFKYHLGNGQSPFYDQATKEQWIKQSPITYAGNVKTPILLLSCTYDTRVPVSQSYKFYRALRDHGTECQFVVFPVGGHYPADPIRNKERYRLWLEWLDKYLN